ncbi:clathrin light chain isoform X3 [Topomyia yanbarensis]|uniref:clathrin light chain isoform X3 n=1 Tax=Topomyia yanbarensis TaxID=2498891 RepID=UPI00273CCB0C|nr:clathrin light chain isoform X3 [Topomyia yanbarensis]
MDAFGDGNFEQSEIDPAAEFLAREQNALAGLEDEIPPLPTGPVDDDVTQPKAEDGNDDFSGYTVPKQVTEEPERIRKWREEQKTRLEEKDREEERKKEELREQARKELEDWYKHHEEAISKTKAANRESAKNAEKQFVAETDEIEPGTEWERIAKLCDFNPKTNKSSKDISRMRSIILQLKQNPISTNKKV